MNRAAEPGSEPLDHALGRSRGGLSTKIHQLVDGNGRPLVIALTAGQAGDSPMLKWLLADLAVHRLGPGRPRTRPDAVLGDKAYSSRANRELLRGKRVKVVIPQPADQIAHRQRRGSAGGRPPDFDAATYKGRNVVERCFNDHKQWRGLATRYDKLPLSTAEVSFYARSRSGSANNETRPSGGPPGCEAALGPPAGFPRRQRCPGRPVGAGHPRGQ